MVKVREDQPVQSDGSVDLDLWLQRIQKDVNIDDVEPVLRACRLSHAAQERAQEGEDTWADNIPGSYLTGLEMAEILADLSLDQDTLVAAILYRAVREKKLTTEEVGAQFGPGVVKLIEGVLLMAAIGSILHPTPGSVLGQSQGQLDNVRKMLVTLIDDVRVALIKLAERTCAIRAVKNADRKRRYRVAREVFDVYAPLAHRLGIGHIKWELEDLSFRYLQPNAYKEIATLLREKRRDRQQYIDNVLATLGEELTKIGISAELMGRAKHIYSIWRKMQRKQIDFHQVYDVRAVRILVPELKDCYAVLGVVHGHWKNIPHEFDDYIASPKKNGYRSLHTAVIGPEGKVLEIQIRTHAMHEDAELGVCAHWLYKGTDTSSKSDSYESKIAWLRQVLEWHEDVGNASETMDQLREGVEQDRIYAFTPDGHVVDLAAGATPLDFAYRVHTEVGHCCRGAKVNGKIVSLNTPLKTGDQVEVMTAKHPSPSRDWMNPNLGYVTSARARAKIRHWFKDQDRDQNILGGRQMAEREMRRLALERVDYGALAEKLNFHQIEDLFAALGAGDLRLSQLIGAAQRQLEAQPREAQLDLGLPGRSETKSKVKPKQGDFVIHGVGNLLTSIASCCKPVPGDPIVGYITQGRGVSIHRQDCINALQLEEVGHERMIEVGWGEESSSAYPVDIRVEAYDRHGLLRDIMVVMGNEKVNVLAVNTRTDKKQNTARLLITVEIESLESLGRIMDKIGQLPNVSDVHRQVEGH
ncbi:GTP diphosphokinase [Motiliproteus sp. SC1-56]|uniref:GTP diphosphokinase n=1 Tax=Motiliproteus sp. SC1-56 TaxID=2799565 RepID=UPI001A8D789A|nr:GTP diphosphokinase [Motiliproteus sp. SC1-56]